MTGLKVSGNCAVAYRHTFHLTRYSQPNRFLSATMVSTTNSSPGPKLAPLYSCTLRSPSCNARLRTHVGRLQHRQQDQMSCHKFLEGVITTSMLMSLLHCCDTFVYGAEPNNYIYLQACILQYIRQSKDIVPDLTVEAHAHDC